MREVDKEEGEKEGEEKKMVIRLFDEEDQSVENRVAYEQFALSTLGIDSANGGWFKHDGEHALFLHTEDEEQVQKRIERGDYVDFSPNKERLAYFRAYLRLWREREERIERIEEIALELNALAR